MAGRYNFVSPGALAQNAITQELMRRATLERQQQLDEEKRQSDLRQAQHQQAMLDFQRQQEARIAEAQRVAQEDVANQRAFTRASTIHEYALPGQTDQATADLLTKQGFGDIVTRQQPTQGAYQGEDASGVPQYDVIPGVLSLTGGTRYQASQAAQQAAAATAAANRQSAEERAREANQTREDIARMAAGGQQESRDIRNQLTQMQIDREKEKLATTQQQKQAGEDAIKTRKRDINAVLNDLLDEKGNLKSDVAGVIGAFDARTPDVTEGANTALSRIDRLMGLLDVNTLNELKRQSPTGATGFGALSEKELAILESASAALRNRKVSEGAYAQELQRIRDTVKEGGTGIVNQGQPVGTRRLIRGQLAEWDGNGWLAVK